GHKAYEQQLAEGQKPLISCDAQRGRFENSSLVPYFVFITKMMRFFFPSALFLIIIDAAFGTLILTSLGVPTAIFTLTLFGTKRQKYAHWIFIILAAITAASVMWDSGGQKEPLKITCLISVS